MIVGRDLTRDPAAGGRLGVGRRGDERLGDEHREGVQPAVAREGAVVGEDLDGHTRLVRQALRLLDALAREVERDDAVAAAREEHGVATFATADVQQRQRPVRR